MTCESIYMQHEKAQVVSGPFFWLKFVAVHVSVYTAMPSHMSHSTQLGRGCSKTCFAVTVSVQDETNLAVKQHIRAL